MKTVDKKRVQNHIQNPAKGNTKACLSGIALCPDQMGQRRVQNGRKCAKPDRPEQIGGGHLKGFLIGHKKRHQHRSASQYKNSVKKRHCCRRPDTKSTAAPCLIPLLCPQKTGDQTGTADSKQIGKRRHKHKQRHCQRSCGHLLRISQLTDKKRICHVINDRNDLAYDRRHRQHQDCLCHRHTGKQFVILRTCIPCMSVFYFLIFQAHAFLGFRGFLLFLSFIVFIFRFHPCCTSLPLALNYQ